MSVGLGVLSHGLIAPAVPVAPYTAAANVRSGTDRGDGVVGTLAVPSAGNVRLGVAVDATTGTLVLPAVNKVLIATGFGAGGSEFTGTLVPSGYVPPELDGLRNVSPRDAILALLYAQPELAERIGERWFPHWADQDTETPYGVVWATTSRHESNLDGASGLAFTNIQVDVVSKTLAESDYLAEAVRLTLTGFVGDVLVVDESIRVQSIELDSDVESYELLDDYGNNALTGKTMEFIVATSEAPTPSP